MATQQLTLSILADLTPRGDGSFMLKPRPLPVGGATGWVSVAEAIQIIGGGMTESTVRRLAHDGILKMRKPTPHRMELEHASVVAYRDGINDPEYWDGKRLRTGRSAG